MSRDGGGIARRPGWCGLAAALLAGAALPVGLWSVHALDVGFGQVLGPAALPALFLGAPGAVVLALAAAVIALVGFARGEGPPALAAAGLAILALLPALVAGVQAIVILTALA